jgi:hypothetical protein
MLKGIDWVVNTIEWGDRRYQPRIVVSVADQDGGVVRVVNTTEWGDRRYQLRIVVKIVYAGRTCVSLWFALYRLWHTKSRT